jgi:predicted DNA-binding protein YlxM (UPF0122 family)
LELDRLRARERAVTLFEEYGKLLSERQRAVLELHLRRDWSLSEIARWQGTSRAAVHDLVKRSLAALEGFETRLGVLAREGRRRAVTRRLQGEIDQLRRRLERLESLVGRS